MSADERAAKDAEDEQAKIRRHELARVIYAREAGDPVQVSELKCDPHLQHLHAGDLAALHGDLQYLKRKNASGFQICEVPGRGFVQHALKKEAHAQDRARKQSASDHAKGQEIERMTNSLRDKFESKPGQPMLIADLMGAASSPGVDVPPSTPSRVQALVKRMHAIEVMSKPPRFVLNAAHRSQWEGHVDAKIAAVLAYTLTEPVSKTAMWDRLKEEITKPVFDAALVRLQEPSNPDQVIEGRGGFMLKRGVVVLLDLIKQEVCRALKSEAPVKHLKIRDIVQRINSTNAGKAGRGTRSEADIKTAADDLEVHRRVVHTQKLGYILVDRVEEFEQHHSAEAEARHRLVDEITKKILLDGGMLGGGKDATCPQKLRDHILPHPLAKDKQISQTDLSESLERLKATGDVVELPHRGYLHRENDQRRLSILNSSITELVGKRWRDNKVCPVAAAVLPTSGCCVCCNVRGHAQSKGSGK